MQSAERPFSSSDLPLGNPEPLPPLPNGPAGAALGDRLVQPRLGIYTGLFYALRAKHAPTAAHALRVAMGCSQWAGWRRMEASERDLLEVASLLHDVGKIGIPDRVLQKPSHLDSQEQLMMEMQCSIASELLRGAGAKEELIEVVRHCRIPYATKGPDQPLAARILAIVDAYDSMTTEQVFRRALSRERAISELFAYAGSQFDPQLVEEFASLVQRPRPELDALIIDRWLTQLLPHSTPGFWESDSPVSCAAVQNIVDTLFHRKLLDSLSDAAVYLDSECKILHWNRSAERLTGRQAPALIDRFWSPNLMGLQSESGDTLAPDECPLHGTLATHTQVHARLQVQHLDGRMFQVNFSALPVFTGGREFSGVILLVRDASAQVSLEERVQSLHVIASRDPLTKVANRAEMDLRLPEFLAQHLELGQPGSVIMCDIDHFKAINDTYGHQAGDDALVTFSGVLREASRSGDLIVRYGGEEFVLLCSGCDNPAATARAEEIRRAIERTPIPSLDGTNLTASFGVTEIQAGDTETTLVARADRALLRAKSSGRNQVIQLGAGQQSSDAVDLPGRPVVNGKASWLGWFRGAPPAAVVESECLAAVPHAVAIQKLEGFISDHQADILEASESQVTLRIDGPKFDGGRRRGERPATMLMDISLSSLQLPHPRCETMHSVTLLKVTIRPVRPRDRRIEAVRGQATQLLASFNSYLVTQELTPGLKALLRPACSRE